MTTGDFVIRITLIFADGKVCRDFSRCGECLAYVDGDTGRQIPIGMRKDFFAEHLAEVDVAISPSRYLAETYIKAGFPREKMHVVVHGMDLEKMGRVRRVAEAGVCRVTFIGLHMGEHKGVGLLVEAMERFRDDPRVRVQLVGRGHMDEQLAGDGEGAGAGGADYFSGAGAERGDWRGAGEARMCWCCQSV